MASKGECEFAEDVATELPLIGILELLGVPLDDREKFFEWTNTMIFADDPDMSISEEEGQLASLEVIQYALNLAIKCYYTIMLPTTTSPCLATTP